MTAGNGKNRFHIVDKPFARGGEGCVHDVKGQPGLVAKIYHAPGRTALREAKIKAMLQSPPGGDANAQIAWPQEILYDAASGAFLGFVMPRIQNASKIDALYSYDNRDQHHWAWYIQAAQNLCAAVHSVHKSGHVIGDLNPANICVDPRTAIVTLVDTDSYSVRAKNGKTYPCTVCRQEYVPAEIHRMLDRGDNLKRVQGETFTVYTDYFALGLHVFALLMNGCHPYACTVQAGAAEETYNLLANIRAGYFPFAAGAVPGVGVPRYAPPLAALPPLLQNACNRTFAAPGRLPAGRATATEWHAALQQLEENLSQCGANAAHQYWARLPACPFCATAATMKQVLESQKRAAPTPAARPGALPGTAGGVARYAPQTTRTASRAGSIFSDLAAAAGMVGKFVLAMVLWLGWNVLAHWLLLQVPLFTWWWTLLRFASLGIIPFVPLWVFAIFASFGFGFAEDMANILARATRWVTILLYGGVALFFGIGSGVVNMVLWTVLACLPSVMLCRWAPGLTWDMSW